MGRINNTNRYPLDTNVTVKDYLIGSDAESSVDEKYRKTKNYRIQDIIALVPTENTDSFNFGYRYTEVIDVNTNPAYFTTNDSQIENITSLTFNKVNSEGEDISEFFNTITGNESNIIFNVTDGSEDNFGFFQPTGVTNPTPDTYVVAVTPIGTLQKGSLIEGQIYTSTFAVQGSSGGGSVDYVSNVAFDGSNLNFTGIGSAFGGSVDLSSLIVDLTPVESPWDNINGFPANQSSTDINYNAGKIGIGLPVSTAPGAELEIISTNIDPLSFVLRVQIQSSGKGFIVDNNGNVTNQGGLYTTYGSGAGLDGQASTYFGINAGQNSTAISQDNTFLGYLSGQSNTNGNDNTFVGSSSGTSNTEGNRNTFSGHFSGRFNTLGSDNSFYGDNSGTNNTTGNSNCFYGSGSGASNLTASFNSFYGVGSGGSNITGSTNSFYGWASGFNNVGGNGNSFYGVNSGRSNTAGRNNCFYGATAGDDNTEGDFNCFFGNQAGRENTTASYNNSFGYESLLNNILGEDNVALGHLAGSVDNLAVNVTSVNQSIFLGNETKPLSNGGTNEVVIGHGAIGNGDNTITLGNTSNVRTYNKGVNNVSNAYTVATLPTGVQGDVAYVTDANFISYRAVVAGGGSSTALVFFDGTNWLYH